MYKHDYDYISPNCCHFYKVAESEHAEGEETSPAETEGDGIGIANIVIDVADKSTQPAQVCFNNY